jgi:hypothetical protein
MQDLLLTPLLLVALLLGFVLYRRRQRRKELHTPLIRSTSLDKNGNLIRFILLPRSLPYAAPIPSGKSMVGTSPLHKP